MDRSHATTSADVLSRIRAASSPQPAPTSSTRSGARPTTASRVASSEEGPSRNSFHTRRRAASLRSSAYSEEISAESERTGSSEGPGAISGNLERADHLGAAGGHVGCIGSVVLARDLVLGRTVED